MLCSTAPSHKINNWYRSSFPFSSGTDSENHLPNFLLQEFLTIESFFRQLAFNITSERRFCRFSTFLLRFSLYTAIPENRSSEIFFAGTCHSASVILNWTVRCSTVDFHRSSPPFCDQTHRLLILLFPLTFNRCSLCNYILAKGTWIVNTIWLYF